METSVRDFRAYRIGSVRSRFPFDVDDTDNEWGYPPTAYSSSSSPSAVGSTMSGQHWFPWKRTSQGLEVIAARFPARRVRVHVCPQASVRRGSATRRSSARRFVWHVVDSLRCLLGRQACRKKE